MVEGETGVQSHALPQHEKPFCSVSGGSEVLLHRRASLKPCTDTGGIQVCERGEQGP